MLNIAVVNMTVFNETVTKLNATEEMEPMAIIIFYVTNYVFLPILGTMGITGNILNILIFHYGKMKTTTYVYLRFLAVIDLLLSLDYSLLGILAEGTFVFDSLVLCYIISNIIAPVTNVLAGISNLLTTSVTVERYLAVCHPINYKKLQTPKIAQRICIIIVTLGVILQIPAFLQFRCFTDENLVYHLILEDRKDYMRYLYFYTFLREIIVHISPLLLLVILNSCTAATFQKISKNRRKMKSTESDEKIKAEKRLLTLLAGLTGSYFIFTLPVTLFFIVNEICGCAYSTGLTAAEAAGIESTAIFEISNSVFPFYIYIIFNKDVRHIFKALTTRKKIVPQETTDIAF